MKKFKFRLESVLKVRQLRKKIAEREVALTQSKITKTDKDIKETDDAWTQSFRIPDDGAVNMAFWSQINNHYRNGLEARKAQLEERKDKLNEQLDVEKKKLTRRMSDEMVMDKLKEYQKQEHLKEAEAEEQANIEEIDLLKRGRQS